MNHPQTARNLAIEKAQTELSVAEEHLRKAMTMNVRRTLARRMPAMKLRHAAALALVGWYLMLPPLPMGQTEPDERARLGDWYIFEPFDTGSACQSELVQIADMKSERRKSLLANQGDDKQRQYLIRAFSHGECVATDDPRLAK